MNTKGKSLKKRFLKYSAAMSAAVAVLMLSMFPSPLKNRAYFRFYD